MNRLSKVFLSLVTAALILFMVTACATQPAPEVVKEEPIVVVEPEPIVEAEPVVEEPAVEVAEPAVEVIVEAEPVVKAVVKAETFRIMGTNGLLELAAATYEGGLGFAEVSAIVEYARAGYPTLVVDAGSNNVSIPDLGLGLEDGAALAAVVDAIGYDAMTPGTEDLLFGVEALQMLDAATDMAVISANMEKDGKLIFAPSTLVEVGDISIGIFGLTTPLANKMGVSVSPVQSDLMAAAEAAVIELESQGADFIIALTNMGFERAGFSEADLNWAAEYVTGHIDLIIDGMGSIPYQEIRGTTMYVQLGGSLYIGGLEVTVRGGQVVEVEQLLITQEMAAELEPSEEVSALLAAEGERLAGLVTAAAVVEPVVEVEEPVVEAVVEIEEEPVVEAVVEVEPVVEAVVKAETFRIIGTNGLLELAAATYEGGLGFAEVSAIVEYARAGYPTLVVDAGSNNVSIPDLGLGLEDGAALAAVVDAIGYDAMTPGTEDLLFGVEALQMLDAATDMAVISANMEKDGKLIFAPSTLVEVGDISIGIFGLTTPLANKMGVSVSPVQSDLMAAAEAAVIELEAQGADFIIALTNMGFERAGFSEADLNWAAEYVTGHIDLIIDGMGSIPYQEIRGTTMYVQLGGSSYVGGLEVTVRGGQVVEVEQLLITQEMAAELEPNEEVSALLAAEGERLAGLVTAAVVVEIEEPVVEVEEPVVEAVVEIEEEPVVEAVVEVEPVVKAVVKAETFRIIGTNGLLELAAATYEGGLGFAEVSAIVEYARAGYPTLVVDAGSNNVSIPDFGLGLEDGAALAAVVDAIGYDAMTPGTEDLLFGVEALQMLDAATDMAVISANMEKDGKLIFAPSTLVEVGDISIGIFGLTTPLANKMGVSVSPVQSDLMAAAEAAVIELEAQGADFIIALTNMGFERAGFSEADLNWAAEYVTGHIDLIIDGMGSIPYQEIRGTTMYVQLGGSSYVGGLEVTVRGGQVVEVEQLLITQEMAAELEPSEEVSALLAAEGERLAVLVTAAAVVEPVVEVEEPVVEAEPVEEEPAPVVEEEPEVEEVVAAAVVEPVAEVEEPVVEAEPVEEEPTPVVEEEPEVEEVVAAAVVEPAPVEAVVEVIEEAIVDPYYAVKAAGDVENFTLTIVHTNDTHGRLEEGKYDGMGFAKIATVIEYVNSVSETTLILDAGDAFHGTNAATLTEGESIAKLMDGTYDALAPGNHDFNYGVDQLLALDEMTDFPFLSANVTKAGELLFQPYKIFEYYGVKVAVVGLTTPETAYKTHPKNVEGVYFDQPPAWALTDADEYGKVSLAETAVLIQAGVDLLRKEADMVIVLAHIGMDEESAITSTLIAENIDGIDLIIDGHSHTELPEGMVVNGTVIAQAGQYGMNVGIINVEIAGGEITGITPFLYTKAEAAEIEPNAAVAAYIEEVNAEVESFTMQEIATLPYALDGERAHVRTRPTNLTKILTTAMMETTGADAALTNGGGIRASIDAGNVTIGEVITVLPFNNTIVVIEVTGAELLAAIENGIKDLPNPSGAYPQMGGVEAIWNRFNDPGERLFKVKVGGKIVDPLATYRLATNDFLAAGGDQYTMFADKPLLEEYGLMAEIFGYYLVETFPLED